MSIFPTEEDKRHSYVILSFIIGFCFALIIFKFELPVTDGIALIAACVAIAALLWQINTSINQSKIQTYLTYTQRYRDIVINFPIGVESSTFNLPTDDEQLDSLLRWLRAYFDLCSEQKNRGQRAIVSNIWYC